MVDLVPIPQRSFQWGPKIKANFEALNAAKTEAADVQVIADAAAEAKFVEVVANPNDSAVAALVETPGSATATALNSTYGAPARGVVGRQYRMILGALRNTGDGFAPINDSAHAPTFIESVTQSATQITINHAELGAAKVASLVVVPDETFAAQGFTMGASVGLTSSNIQIWRTLPDVSAYIAWNGSSWTTTLGQGIVSIGAMGSPTAGQIQVNHASVSGVDVQLVGRGPVWRPVVGAVGGAGETLTNVSFVNSAGTVATTPDTDMKFFFRRGGRAREVMNPANLNTTAYPNSNIWVIGVMETTD